MYLISLLALLACHEPDLADTGDTGDTDCDTDTDTDTDPPAHQLLADAAEVLAEAMVELGLTAWSGTVADGQLHLVVELRAATPE